MGMKVKDLNLIFNVFHSKGVVLWVGDMYDCHLVLFEDYCTSICTTENFHYKNPVYICNQLIHIM